MSSSSPANPNPGDHHTGVMLLYLSCHVPFISSDPNLPPIQVGVEILMLRVPVTPDPGDYHAIQVVQSSNPGDPDHLSVVVGVSHLIQIIPYTPRVFHRKLMQVIPPSKNQEIQIIQATQVIQVIQIIQMLQVMQVYS